MSIEATSTQGRLKEEDVKPGSSWTKASRDEMEWNDEILLWLPAMHSLSVSIEMIAPEEEAHIDKIVKGWVYVMSVHNSGELWRFRRFAKPYPQVKKGYSADLPPEANGKPYDRLLLRNRSGVDELIRIAGLSIPGESDLFGTRLISERELPIEGVVSDEAEALAWAYRIAVKPLPDAEPGQPPAEQD